MELSIISVGSLGKLPYYSRFGSLSLPMSSSDLSVPCLLHLAQFFFQFANLITESAR